MDPFEPLTVTDPKSLAAASTTLLAAIDDAADPVALAGVMARAEALRRPDLGEGWWRELADAAFEKHLVLITEGPQPVAERLASLVRLADGLGDEPMADGMSLLLDLAADLGSGADLLPVLELAWRMGGQQPAFADQAKLIAHRALRTADTAGLAAIAAAARRWGAPAVAELAEARLTD